MMLRNRSIVFTARQEKKIAKGHLACLEGERFKEGEGNCYLFL